jgi:hypothetical protein
MHSGISCREAKQKDLADYLAEIGYHPNFVKGDDHWYLSPLRAENTPSFKVNQRLNLWFDHGIGKGGNLIDFGTLYYQCSVRELLGKLGAISSFQQQIPRLFDQLKTQPPSNHSPIQIMAIKPIESPELFAYLTRRKIPIGVAQNHCRQVDFELYGRQISALGFANLSGGYELRNTNFKGCSPPKDFTCLDGGSDQVAVFEGFFSFLSFRALQVDDSSLTNFLVLNSLSFLEKARSQLENHRQISLFLDNDRAGRQSTTKALGWGTQYQDRSHLFVPYKDLNDFLQEIDNRKR